MAAAARALGWSQPTLAHHIDTLEGYLNSPVVRRRPRGSELTPAGRALQAYSPRIIELLSVAEQAARAADPVRAHVTIGVFSTAAAFIVPPAIPALSALGISIDVIQEDDAVSLRRHLAHGSADASIVYGLPEDPAREGARELLREPLYVLLPSHHPLAKKSEVTLEQLAGEGWVLAKSPGDPCDELLFRAAQMAGFHPRGVLKTDDYTVLQGFVAVGLGVALVPAMAVLLSGPNVVAVPVSGRGMERVVRLETAPHASSSEVIRTITSALETSAGNLRTRLSRRR